MARIAIIGGGASGLTASIYAAKKHDVTIYERNSVCGKKSLFPVMENVIIGMKIKVQIIITVTNRKF